MRIGFDISQTGGRKAGCGFFAHALVEALLEQAPSHEYALYPSFGDFFFDPLMPLANPYRAARVSYGPRPLSREGAARFWNAPGLESSLGTPDIVHSNNFWCPLGLAKSRLVYTCYDLGFAFAPDWTTEANRVGCFEGVFRSAVAADWIVAISQASRSHYLGMFPHFPPDRIRVINPCSRFSRGSAAAERPRSLAGLREGGYWLSVGTIEPRKNQRMLVEAYARYLAGGGAAMPLVLAGGEGWLMEGFGEWIAARGLAGRVHLAGYVSDAELAWLYANCHANLYPSLFEGFGLPVLEGFEFGAATIASSSSSLPEVAGDAAILVDPADTAAWTRAMLELAPGSERLARLREAARCRASGFDPSASARELLALYEEAVASPKR